MSDEIDWLDETIAKAKQVLSAALQERDARVDDLAEAQSKVDKCEHALQVRERLRRLAVAGEREASGEAAIAALSPASPPSEDGPAQTQAAESETVETFGTNTWVYPDDYLRSAPVTAYRVIEPAPAVQSGEADAAPEAGIQAGFDALYNTFAAAQNKLDAHAIRAFVANAPPPSTQPEAPEATGEQEILVYRGRLYAGEPDGTYTDMAAPPADAQPEADPQPIQGETV